MTDFNGFPRQLPKFFDQLEKNNTKEWFLSHKKDYEAYIKHPSEQFVCAMGEKLHHLCPDINAIPKINKSLFRINRDTRFATDKKPYKTNLGILFWEGPDKRMESSGFYFHLEANRMMIGCGMHLFPKTRLHDFRQAVMDKKKGPDLEKTAEQIRSKGYEIGTRHYKMIPRGFDPESDLEKEYLLYNGLTARLNSNIPDAAFSSDIVEIILTHFKNMAPIHEWIVKNLLKTA